MRCFVVAYNAHDLSGRWEARNQADKHVMLAANAVFHWQRLSSRLVILACVVAA